MTFETMTPEALLSLSLCLAVVIFKSGTTVFVDLDQNRLRRLAAISRNAASRLDPRRPMRRGQVIRLA
jgi:hypothetical protein